MENRIRWKYCFAMTIPVEVMVLVLRACMGYDLPKSLRFIDDCFFLWPVNLAFGGGNPTELLVIGFIAIVVGLTISCFVLVVLYECTRVYIVRAIKRKDKGDAGSEGEI